MAVLSLEIAVSKLGLLSDSQLVQYINHWFTVTSHSLDLTTSREPLSLDLSAFKHIDGITITHKVKVIS